MTTTTAASRGPGAQTPVPRRRMLRRRLLLWSIPVLVLLLLLAVKLVSVSVLGNRLPGQFAERDRDAMASTLRWLDLGSFGRDSHSTFAAGDLHVLDGDLPGALQRFEAAHRMDPGACPPRANFALVSETLSDEALRDGRFIDARTLLEPAAAAAGAEPSCFATSPAPTADLRAIVAQTPQRLADKLAALKSGAITKTSKGYDYLRTPGGGIVKALPGGPCPVDDEARLRECIARNDTERAQSVQRAEEQQASEQPGGPDRSPAPEAPPAPALGPGPGTQPGAGAPPLFPRIPGEDEPWNPFCVTTGEPLQDLGAALCSTSGPLP